jgi:DNA polymerase III alpha subunit
MDIDIDLKTSFNPNQHFPQAVLASIVSRNELTKHPCGVYFQRVPTDPVTHLCAIPHKFAENLGYMKIDFLHLNVMDYFNSKQEIKTLLRKTPKWGLMLKSDVVEKLFQLNNSGDIIRKIQPTSIQEIADCISIIRPGKTHLLNDYILDRVNTRRKLYTIEPGSYAYKKGHAVAYAMIVVLQLHLIEAGVL